jgi:hypothetical protein
MHYDLRSRLVEPAAVYVLRVGPRSVRCWIGRSVESVVAESEGSPGKSAGEFAGASPWRKSTFSTQGECLEVAFVEDIVMVRNSRYRTQPHLAFQAGAWRAFLAGVRDGGFD